MTATAHLYELAEARAILDEFLLEQEGEETPEIADLWERLEGETTDKIERWGLWLLDRSADVKKLKEEEKRLELRRTHLESAIERSKAELMRQLNILGKSKVQGVRTTVAIQQNSAPSVTHVLEPEELYALEDARGFVTREMVPKYSINRPALLGVWKMHPASVPPAFTIHLGSHIRVR